MSAAHHMPKEVERELRQMAGNDRCVDCGTPGPQWASVTYGEFEPLLSLSRIELGQHSTSWFRDDTRPTCASRLSSGNLSTIHVELYVPDMLAFTCLAFAMQTSRQRDSRFAPSTSLLTACGGVTQLRPVTSLDFWAEYLQPSCAIARDLSNVFIHQQCLSCYDRLWCALQSARLLLARPFRSGRCI